MIDKDKPFYPVSMAAQILEISADRLRAYEEECLVKPHRVEKKTIRQKGYKRLYSQNDIEWIGIIRDLIQSGISIPAIRLILYMLPYMNKENINKIQFPESRLKASIEEQWNIIVKLYEHPVYKHLI